MLLPYLGDHALGIHMESFRKGNDGIWGRHGKNKPSDRLVMDLLGEKVTLRPCFFTGLPANYFGSVYKRKKSLLLK